MKSLILQTASRLLFPLMLLFSLFLLLRGHNDPGGGFVGGLVAGGTFALHAFAHDVKAARRASRVDPRSLLAVGLLIAAASGLVSLVRGQAFMVGQWTTLAVPLVGEVVLGTPLLFDVGVYLVVTGATLTILYALAEE